AVGIAFAEIAGGVAHRLAGAAELIELILPLCLALAGIALPLLIVVAEAAALKILEQFVEPVAQRLLVLPQITERIAIGLLLARFAFARRAPLAGLAPPLAPFLAPCLALFLALPGG